MGTSELYAGGGDNPGMNWHPIQGGVERLSVASWYRNRDKLRPDGPLGLNADSTFFYLTSVGLHEVKLPFKLFVNCFSNMLCLKVLFVFIVLIYFLKIATKQSCSYMDFCSLVFNPLPR